LIAQHARSGSASLNLTGRVNRAVAIRRGSGASTTFAAASQHASVSQHARGPRRPDKEA